MKSRVSHNSYEPTKPTKLSKLVFARLSQLSTALVIFLVLLVFALPTIWAASELGHEHGQVVHVKFNGSSISTTSTTLSHSSIPSSPSLSASSSNTYFAHYSRSRYSPTSRAYSLSNSIPPSYPNPVQGPTNNPPPSNPPAPPKQPSPLEKFAKSLYDSTHKWWVNLATSIYKKFVCYPNPYLMVDVGIYVGVASVFILALGIFKYFLKKITDPNGASAYAELVLYIEHIIFNIVLFVFVLFLMQAFIDKNGNYYLMDFAKRFTMNLVSEMAAYSTFTGLSLELVYQLYGIVMHFPLTSDSLLAFDLPLGHFVRPLIDGASFILEFMTLAMGEWMAKYLVLCFTDSYLLTVIFPIGMIFRAIKLTEGLGNNLIAISLSLFFLYPFLLSIDAAIYTIFIGWDTPNNMSIPMHQLTFTGGIIATIFGASTTAFLGKGALQVVTKDKTIRSVLASFFSKLGINFGRSGSPSATTVRNLRYFVSSAFVGVFRFFAGLSLAYLVARLVLYVAIQSAVIIGLFSVILTALNVYIVIGATFVISRAMRTPIDIAAIMKVI